MGGKVSPAPQKWIPRAVAALVIATSGEAAGQTVQATQPVPYLSLLARYRATPGCQNAAYPAVAAASVQPYVAYHITAPADPRSVSAGRMAAERADDLAAVQAAKGCNALALGNWRFVIRAFDGPVFADLQARAVAGLRRLDRARLASLGLASRP